MTANIINQTELKYWLAYDPVTGLFTWRKNRCSVMRGDIAGTIKTIGYRQICVNRKLYIASRLAFLWMTGRFPDGQVDHKDHDRANDSWRNLRDVTHHENGKNQSLSIRNKTGVVGVCWDKKAGKWVAEIRAENRHIYLGAHKLFDDAVTARKSAEVRYGFYKNHGQEPI